MKKAKKLTGILYIGVFIIIFTLAINGLKDGRVFGADSTYFAICLPVSRILYLIIHELSHAVFIKLGKLEIRCFSVFGITYDGASKKVSFKAKDFHSSGYVVPGIPYSIDSEINFIRFKKAYIYSLLAGPVCPLLLCLAFAPLRIYAGEIGAAFFVTFLINTGLMVISAAAGNNGNMGDFQAALFFGNDINLAGQLLEDIEEMKGSVSPKERMFLAEKSMLKEVV